ncbi:CD2 antigen cytoplasmic tail-binding protein 2 [Biomphalaria pfeifferi]|uniref:CD2 antigen cytoplasmic tail-binding protein 2 n=1 Tax=Biomphalaria pfeifferi TaxID=112525 RepID=A0AAD8CA82_BIOPF|nr:CD2 antigen cytoplasmic tail-binding protein 2 [Biomphalaria pfeifferi]
MTSLSQETSDKSTRFKEKHSLDSDEEDNEVKYDVLAEDDIEGQEEATIEFDENIQITPFNMREELEEGHFDTDGTYIFNKTKEIHDNWIDNIDWVQVKHTKPEDENKKRPFEYSDSSDDEDEEKKTLTNIETYEAILGILKEGETAAKAIRRLAKNKAKIPSASQKWKNKKCKTSNPSEEDQAAIDNAISEQKEMLRLTELCDRLVQQGLVEIYETPYERIAFTLKQMKDKNKSSRLTLAETMKDDDALDIFADDFNSKEAEKIKADGTNDLKESTSSLTSEDTSENQGKEDNKAQDEKEGVMWEYKVDNSEDSELKGPFTTSQMIIWAEDGTFGSGVFCRKYKTHGQFYNSSRLDFELYE